MSFWSHFFDDDPFVFQGFRAPQFANDGLAAHLGPLEASPSIVTRDTGGIGGAGPLAVSVTASIANPHQVDIDTASPGLVQHLPEQSSLHFAPEISPEGQIVAPGPEFLMSMPGFFPAAIPHDGGDFLFG